MRQSQLFSVNLPLSSSLSLLALIAKKTASGPPAEEFEGGPDPTTGEEKFPVKLLAELIKEGREAIPVILKFAKGNKKEIAHKALEQILKKAKDIVHEKGSTKDKEKEFLDILREIEKDAGVPEADLTSEET